MDYNSSTTTKRLHYKSMHALNTDRLGCAVTLTTAHHFSGNITHPRQGFREMGVLEEYGKPIYF